MREREIRVESFGEPNIDVLPEEVRNAFFFSLLQKITEFTFDFFFLLGKSKRKRVLVKGKMNCFSAPLDGNE